MWNLPHSDATSNNDVGFGLLVWGNALLLEKGKVAAQAMPAATPC